MTDRWAGTDHDPLCPSITDRLGGWTVEDGVWKQSAPARRKGPRPGKATSPAVIARRAGRQARWEKNRRKGNYAAFIGRYPKACWHCGGETFGERCAFAEDDVLVHVGCLVLMDPNAKVYDRHGTRLTP